MKLTTTTGGGSTLRTIRLWRDESSEESDEAILREQLDAMSTFARGWLEPLAVSVDVVCCDPAQAYSSYGVTPPPIHGWQLRTPTPGVSMEPTRIGGRIEECDAIDAGTVESFVLRALDQRCFGNAVTGVEWVSWQALCVRLPSIEATQFFIDDYDLIEVPVERRSDGSAWVSGPRSEAVTGHPFWFHVAEGDFRFDVIWGLWPEGAGRQQVDAAVERVLARGTGWYRAQ